MVGLGGCPVAVTVYPPGRGCLHSALLAQSPGCVVYHSTERQVVRGQRFAPRKNVFRRRGDEPAGLAGFGASRDEF